MSKVTMSSFAYALQEYYSNLVMEDLVGRDHPFLAMLLKKKKKVSGEVFVHPLLFSNGDGRSATFTDAQGNPSGSKGLKMKIDVESDYANVLIDNEVLLSSEGADAKAFMSARTAEFDAKFSELGNSLSHSLFRSGAGTIGKVAATQNASLDVITLANADDIIFFEVGQRIQPVDLEVGGTLGAVSYIKSINRSAGTFQVAATDGGVALTGTASGFIADQFIVRKGDYGQKVKGLQAWLPTSVSGSDNFYGINRSSDKERLAGWYLDESATADMSEKIQNAVKTVCRFSQAKPDLVILSFADWTELQKSLASQVQYIDVKPNQSAVSGFKGIVINGPRGSLNVIADADCPYGEMFVISSDTWSLIHKGDNVPMFLSTDGNQILRAASADAIECRIGYYASICCTAPGYNARVKIR